jgi:hypothetical protein
VKSKKQKVGVAPMEYLLASEWPLRKICSADRRSALPTWPNGWTTDPLPVHAFAATHARVVRGAMLASCSEFPLLSVTWETARCRSKYRTR